MVFTGAGACIWLVIRAPGHWTASHSRLRTSSERGGFRMTELPLSTFADKPPTAHVYAFPPARHVQTVEKLLTRYLSLCQAHGYPEAVKIFEARHANPIRRRLTAAGVP